MRLRYNPRYNIAHIRFQEECSGVESVRVGEELVVDMAPDGTIYGIELLNANEQLRQENGEGLVVVNEATGERTEVPLALGQRRAAHRRGSRPQPSGMDLDLSPH